MSLVSNASIQTRFTIATRQSGSSLLSVIASWAGITLGTHGSGNNFASRATVTNFAAKSNSSLLALGSLNALRSGITILARLTSVVVDLTGIRLTLDALETGITIIAALALYSVISRLADQVDLGSGGVSTGSSITTIASWFTIASLVTGIAVVTALSGFSALTFATIGSIPTLFTVVTRISAMSTVAGVTDFAFP